MTDKAISPLRQRMIEDMTARHFDWVLCAHVARTPATGVKLASP